MSEHLATCVRCERTAPLDDFAKDRRRPLGRKSICRECDRRDVAERRAGKRAARPGALVLVPRFPTAPAPAAAEVPSPPAMPEPVEQGPMRVEIERTLAALDPPPGDLDAAVVAQLRSAADLYDRCAWSLDAAKLCPPLQTKMIAALRELKATRATRSQDVAKPASKLDRFRAGGGAS